MFGFIHHFLLRLRSWFRRSNPTVIRRGTPDDQYLVTSSELENGIRESEGPILKVWVVAPEDNLSKPSFVTLCHEAAKDDTTFSSAHTQSGMYQTYEIDSQVEEKPLILQAPISSPASPNYQSGGTQSTNPGITPTPIPNSTSGDSSAFIRIGPSQWERVVRVCAKRHGLPPRLPNPNPHFRDGDGVLNVLKGKIELTNEPLRLPDGTFDYVVRAEYRYGLSRAPMNMKFGSPDYENSPTIGSNQFQFSLVNIYSSHQPIG